MWLIVKDLKAAGPAIIKALRDIPSIELHSITPRVPKLEAIFLAATKRSWEETLEPQTRAS
jgi:hypothetical protein